MDEPTNSVTQGASQKTENEETTRDQEKPPAEAKRAVSSGGGSDDAPEGDNFQKLYEESLRSIQEGEVTKGEIVQIDKEFVLVDIGYKSEGQIRLDEFQRESHRQGG